MSNDFYIISTNATIKSTPKKLDKAFKKDLVTDNGNLKPYVEKIIDNVFYYGKQCINATLPSLFIQIEYKDSNKDIYLIEHEIFLYEEDYPTYADLVAYKEKVAYGFASQVTQATKDIVEAFHNGYGCECLSSGDY